MYVLNTKIAPVIETARFIKVRLIVTEIRYLIASSSARQQNNFKKDKMPDRQWNNLTENGWTKTHFYRVLAGKNQQNHRQNKV